MSSQMLNDQTFSPGNIPADLAREASSTMTLNGTILKSLALLGLTVLAATVGWRVGLDWFAASSGGLWWLIGYFLLIGLTIAAASNPDLARPAGLVYALLMGFWMGAVSRVYEEEFDGIVTQALLASVSVFVVCLLLYLVRAIRVTPTFTRVIVTATLGILVMYLASWILAIFGVDLLLLTEPSTLGIAVSIGICLVAAFSLFLGLATIENGIALSAPAAMEWYAALGLLSTLVWLYAELLRLLALLRNR